MARPDRSSHLPDVAQLLEQRSAEAMALNQRHLNPQLGRILRTLGFDREWVEGRGSYLIDRQGNEYLDLLSGYGVFSLGRSHPYVKQQLTEVIAANTANLPQLGVSTLPGVLAERLIARAPAPLDGVVLTSSGTEAVETAIKLARAATGRPRIIYCDHAFHGLTLGSLSVNGNEEFRERFEPLLPGCAPVPFGDLEALRRELEKGEVAAFLVEPVQGKGVHLPPDGYLEHAQQLCHDAAALFIVDDVQVGLGRTGRFFTAEHWQLAPDIVTVAKALSGGYVPIGAVLASRRVLSAVFDSMERGVVIGSTFGGNDLAAASGIATINVIEQDGLVDRAARMGDLLLDLTRPLTNRFEIVREIRGLGLIWAIELGPPAGKAARRLWDVIERRQPGLFSQLVTVPLFRDHRILTQVAGHHMNVVKALPPLVIEEEGLRRFAGALEEVLEAAEERLFRSYASLGLELGRRSLAARRV